MLINRHNFTKILMVCFFFFIFSCGRKDNISALSRKYRALSDDPYSEKHKPRLKMNLAQKLFRIGAFRKGMTVDEVEAIVGRMPEENRVWAIREREEGGRHITTRDYPIHAAGGVIFEFMDGLLESWELYEDD